jgi:small subunit ribosomal protein S2
MVDCKIPGNDDAIRAIRLFCSAMADAVIEGKALCEQADVKAEKQEAEYTEESGVSEELEPAEIPVVGEG